MIPSLGFGRTGHESSRLIFGAAALFNATPEETEEALALLLDNGINHIDVAASYGEAELRVGEWMPKHRDAFFLATKTGERTYQAAREQIRASLERTRTDHLDLIQLHNLVKPDEWEEALGPDGALRAAEEARDEGLVRFIGVTGHGTRVASMHLESLERFDFDSVLLPYNHTLMADAKYAADFEALLASCAERDVAVQTIKSAARRRWPDGTGADATTWYEPLRDEDALTRAVHWALARPGVFVNSASDLSLLPLLLRAARSFEAAPDDTHMRADEERLAIEPLFLRGYAASA